MLQLKSLLKEGRSEKIGEEKFKSLYGKKTSKLDTDNLIYRGIEGFHDDFGFIDPRKYKERKSQYTKNYYTLIINNHEHWKNYPKREVICSTNKGRASDFGNLYIVIPLNGVVWGVCPNYDIWFSFLNLKDEAGFYNMGRFNEFLSDVLLKYHGQTEFDSFSEFEFALNQTGNKLVNTGFFEESEYLKKNFLKFWNSYQESEFFEYNGLGSYIFDLLDPEDNGFEYQVNWRGASGGDSGLEVWTDGPCLLLDYKYYRDNKEEFQ